MATHFMKNSNNELKVVINYFDKTELISTAHEAINFINKLSYRGNSHEITCNTHTEKLLIDLFKLLYCIYYPKLFSKSRRVLYSFF